MTVWFFVSAVCYIATAGLGITAWLRGTSFGHLHHAAFAMALTTGIVAAVEDVGPDVIGATALLLAMPFCPARTRRHRVVGMVGLCIYVVGFILRFTGSLG